MTTSLRFCPACGSAGLRRPETKRLYCEACDFSLYLNAAATAAAILTNGDQVLLTVRGKEPMQGFLDLPGGFIDPGEGIEDGLRRELKEELGILVGPLTYFGSWPNTYPYGGVIYQTCDVILTGSITGLPLQAMDDVAGLEWHHPEQLPIDRVAFPSIRAALSSYVISK